MEYVAEGAGLLATALSFFIFQQKKRSNILLIKLACDALWITHCLLLVFFLALNTLGIGLMWSGPWSVCSLISGWLATVAYWQTNPNRFKLLSLAVCASQITYSVGIGSKSALLNELITLTSIGLFFLRVWREARKNKTNKTEQEKIDEVDCRISDSGK